MTLPHSQEFTRPCHICGEDIDMHLLVEVNGKASIAAPSNCEVCGAHVHVPQDVNAILEENE